MKPRLRGHHLICLQFYRGEGYSSEFVENLERVISRAREYGILVVEGADDVCNHCHYLINGKCTYKDNAEEEIRYLDLLALALLELNSGRETTWEYIRKKLPEIIEEWEEKACRNCDWRDVCEVHNKGRGASKH
jgi:hypothetical protein